MGRRKLRYNGACHQTKQLLETGQWNCFAVVKTSVGRLDDFFWPLPAGLAFLDTEAAREEVEEDEETEGDGETSATALGRFVGVVIVVAITFSVSCIVGRWWEEGILDGDEDGRWRGWRSGGVGEEVWASLLYGYLLLGESLEVRWWQRRTMAVSPQSNQMGTRPPIGWNATTSREWYQKILDVAQKTDGPMQTTTKSKVNCNRTRVRDLSLFHDGHVGLWEDCVPEIDEKTRTSDDGWAMRQRRDRNDATLWAWPCEVQPEPYKPLAKLMGDVHTSWPNAIEAFKASNAVGWINSCCCRPGVH